MTHHVKNFRLKWLNDNLDRGWFVQINFTDGSWMQRPATEFEITLWKSLLNGVDYAVAEGSLIANDWNDGWHVPDVEPEGPIYYNDKWRRHD